MEVLLFFAVVFVLWMIFGTSSNHDEEQHQRLQESQKHQNGYHHPLPHPNYPPWESKPDWQDWEYEYYRVPRIYNFQSVLGAAAKGAFATFFAVGILVLLIYFHNKDSGTKPIGQTKQKELVQPERAAIKKSKGEEKQYMRHCAKSLINTGYLVLQKAKNAYPEIEFYYDSTDGLYYAVMYSNDSSALDQLVIIWREKHRKKFGFDFKHYDVSNLCEKNHQSNIVHGDAPYTWLCKACKR